MIPAFQSHSETSRAAALAMYGKVSELQRTILDWVGASPDGLTDEQIQEVSGMSPNTQRPRRVECVRKGLLRDSGRMRKTRSGRMAVVWGAVPDVE
jgi:hypothetical protein